MRNILISSLLGFFSVAHAETTTTDAEVQVRCTEACTVFVLDAPDNDVLVIQRTLHGEEWQRYDGDLISRIHFTGSEAGDVLIVDTTASVSIEAYGRGGNDYLSGSSAEDILDGGVGQDVIEGGGAADVCSVERDDATANCEEQI